MTLRKDRGLIVPLLPAGSSASNPHGPQRVQLGQGLRLYKESFPFAQLDQGLESMFRSAPSHRRRCFFLLGGGAGGGEPPFSKIEKGQEQEAAKC